MSQPPLPISVQILDFPNQSAQVVPAWAGANLSTFLSVAWNVKEAFWKVEGLVNEVAGSKETFNSVIRGIQEDPAGPQIDIKNRCHALFDERDFFDQRLPLNPLRQTASEL